MLKNQGPDYCLFLSYGKSPLGTEDPLCKTKFLLWRLHNWNNFIVMFPMWTAVASLVCSLSTRAKKNLVGNFCIKTWSKSSSFYVDLSSLTQQYHWWITLLAKHLWLCQALSLLQYWVISPHSTFLILETLVMTVMLPFKIACSYTHVASVTPAVVAHWKQSAKQCREKEGKSKHFGTLKLGKSCV